MLKSIQIKIVLIFMLVGILIIALQGSLFIYKLQELNNEITQNNLLETTQISEKISEQENQMKMMIIYSVLIFSAISILVGIFVSKIIIAPISKIIKSTEKIKAGESINIRLFKRKKWQNWNWWSCKSI